MLEEHRPSEIQWRGFVRLLDAGLFFSFLMDELQSRLPDLAPDLSRRINEAWGEIGIERAEDPEFEGDPFPDPLAEYLMELESDVEIGHAPDNALQHIRALGAVSLHSALDTYVRGVLPDRPKSLPDVIDGALRAARQSPLDHKVYEGLVEFDETRHLIVHNHGIVTERYVSRVMNSRFIVGELRTVDGTLLLKYGRVVWDAGLAIRKLLHTRGDRGI